jgi:hypothetical protein
MTKTTVLLMLIAIALASMPAHAQQRVFVSGLGSDSNPCTVTQPCRTFQQAYNTAVANGEIDVLDPAGYGPLTITHGISIQAHGFGGITATSAGTAITISVTTQFDPVSLNGLLLDGGGSGLIGIQINSGRSVQILNSVVRHFGGGIIDETSTNGANLLIEDTIVSDNRNSGIVVNPSGTGAEATLNRITANNNLFGVVLDSTSGVVIAGKKATISNSVISNNSMIGLLANPGTVAWLAKTVISGNQTGVNVSGGFVDSYGDNYINDNMTPVMGSLTPVGMQ